MFSVDDRWEANTTCTYMTHFLIQIFAFCQSWSHFWELLPIRWRWWWKYPKICQIARLWFLLSFHLPLLTFIAWIDHTDNGGGKSFTFWSNRSIIPSGTFLSPVAWKERCKKCWNAQISKIMLDLTRKCFFTFQRPAVSRWRSRRTWSLRGCWFPHWFALGGGKHSTIFNDGSPPFSNADSHECDI